MLVLLMLLLTAIPNSQISWGSTWYVDGDAGASGRGKNWRDVLRSTEEMANIADLKKDDERWVRTKTRSKSTKLLTCTLDSVRLRGG